METKPFGSFFAAVCCAIKSSPDSPGLLGPRCRAGNRLAIMSAENQPSRAMGGGTILGQLGVRDASCHRADALQDLKKSSTQLSASQAPQTLSGQEWQAREHAHQ